MAATNGPSGLQTLTDLELMGLDGTAIPAAVQARIAARAAGTSGAAEMPSDVVDKLSLRFADLKIRHPEYDLAFITECRALYAGGRRLLADPEVMKRLFRKNPYEDNDVYAERLARAHYFPYAGAILDQLVAGLGADPLNVSFAEEDDKGKRTIDADGEWWERWVSDVTCDADEDDEESEKPDDSEEREGGKPIHEFMLEIAREAEQTRSAWVLCTIEEYTGADADPEAPPTSAPKSDAMPCLSLVRAENVIDWQYTSGRKPELEYVLTLEQRTVRSTLSARRNLIEQTYTLWTPTESVTYVVMYDPKQEPTDETEIKPTTFEPHPFGVVPFYRFELPEGVFGMGKMHSLAREHFNKRCAMSWAEYKSLFPILYEFLGSEGGTEMPVPSAQRDAGRATNQVRAQGWTQVRGKDDKAEWISPDPVAYTSARESCNDIMREMYRVMHSMAQSANMDAAALQRSGKSKEQDTASTEVVLDFLGSLLRRAARRLMRLAAKGVGKTLPPADVSGLEHFDAEGVVDAINEAVTLQNGLTIKSALFWELYLSRTVNKILGDRASQEQRETIRKQISEGLVQEQLMAEAMLSPGGAPQPGAPDKSDDEPDDPTDPSAYGGSPPTKTPPGKGIRFSSTPKPKL
jgi:hypothetical protein